MSNRIKLRRSAVQSAVPTTAQIELGELALNTYDGKLYTKKDDGTASIVEIGGGSSGVSSFSAGSTGLTPSTTTTGAITLAGTLAVANGGTGVTTSTGTGSTVRSASPALTGTPTAPTAADGTNTTQLATTAFVSTAVANVIDAAPAGLDTLNELAAALGDDPNFATTVTTSIGTKLPLAGGQMTGNITFSGSQTVDGRDLSVDGAKLDGIESGATADQTASEILTAIKTVDGSGSGLDADTLDGIQASSFARTNTSQTFTGAQIGSINTLTDAATISMNASLANNFTVTLGGNRTFGNPSNMTAGQVGSIFINQDGTGNRTLSWASYWKFPGGTAPTLSTSASAQDRVDYIIKSSTVIHAQFSADLS